MLFKVKETEKIKKLIKAIVYFVNSKEGYVNKTKLLKYLYLVDIEYYRYHQQTFTGFNWVFYKYGPWTREYDDIYDEMGRSGELIIKTGNRPDLDTQFLYTNEEVDLGSIFDSPVEEIRIRRILEKWADESLGKMLDYVYFYTEPMENAEQGKPLDFSKVIMDIDSKSFTFTKSKILREDLERLREKFQKKIEVSKEKKEKSTNYTPPVYDDVFWESVHRMNKDDEY